MLFFVSRVFKLTKNEFYLNNTKKFLPHIAVNKLQLHYEDQAGNAA